MSHSPELGRLNGIKPGDNFDVYLDYTLGGVPEVFAVTQLKCQVRDRNNNLLGQLTMTVDPVVPGRYRGTCLPAVTATWPVGDHYLDVKRTSGGIVSSTASVIVPVFKAVTR